MKNVKILDCTLRDGGRIIDCAFPDAHVKGITRKLTDANVDIIEMGFLRGNRDYSGNSTMFSQLDQIKQFIPENRGNTMYVAFSDYGQEYGMWDFSRIKPYDGKGIDGFRVGYRKKDLKAALETFSIVKDNGYKLFVQGVESLAYSDLEILHAIEIINEVKPYSFGIVDTYGAMYKDDVLRLFSLVDHNLDDEIAIDFHSHNNMQLSFSFAQEVIEASRGVRPVVIDTTLEGLGKGTGNLNTELVVDYLNRKKYYNYNSDIVLDAIDEYIQWMKKDYTWEYQIPYFMAGIYSSHANNIKYLQDKHRVATKDIKNILSLIEPAKRKRYDYDNIERLYKEYIGTKIDDSDTIAALGKELKQNNLLVKIPGASLSAKSDLIAEYINSSKCKVLSVNFVDAAADYVFFGNQRKYDYFREQCTGKTIILSSNVKGDADFVIDYHSLIVSKLKYFDNSAMLLLNALLRADVQNFDIAGLDGFDYNKSNYYSDEYNMSHYEDDYNQINRDMTEFLKEYVKRNNGNISIITGGMFADIF